MISDNALVPLQYTDMVSTARKTIKKYKYVSAQEGAPSAAASRWYRKEPYDDVE